MPNVHVLAGAIAFLFISEVTLAKDFPVQGRVFAGTTQVDPKDLNTELEAQGIKNLESSPFYGAEITYSVARYLDLGIRYSRHSVFLDEINSTSATDYQAELDQDAVSLVARIPFLESKFARVEGFAAFGGTNTALKIKSATLNGQLLKEDRNGWLASPYSVYGASVALGYKKFFLVFEGGFETNKIIEMERVGTLNNNVETLDLSGSYVSVGLLFDGVSTSRK